MAESSEEVLPIAELVQRLREDGSPLSVQAASALQVTEQMNRIRAERILEVLEDTMPGPGFVVSQDDLRVDMMRGTGQGSIRITHIPSGKSASAEWLPDNDGPRTPLEARMVALGNLYKQLRHGA